MDPAVQALVTRGTYAVPSFTMTSGPVPDSLGKGYVKGPAVESAEERASLAALYCAQMVSEQLDAITSKDDIIIDGPFSQNPVLLGVLAALRPRQKVMASTLRDGTTAGAAALAMIEDGKLPTIAIRMAEVAAAEIAGLGEYQAAWKTMAYERR